MSCKYLYIYTIGCQMNVYDSEQFAKVLKPLGYELTFALETADLIIANTCSVRKKAEEKAFSFLGRLSTFKKKKPDLIICMAGCVAQQEGQNIINRFAHVDFVFGTHAIGRLADHIATIEKERAKIVDTEETDHIYEVESFGHDILGKNVLRFVTIMRGCDNFCTYCVVPYVRGREVSRNPDNIIKEIQELVKFGMREVTLLGQNVNSYGQKEGLCSFAQLLEKVNDIKGLKRIRFATSHPKDLSDELIYAFRDLDKLCNHIHLPVQSGSNSVLKRMNRKYSVEKYLERVEKLKQVCPGISLSSDMIVGFPGETSFDFEQTIDLVNRVGFDGLFAFIYSDRPNAPAVAFKDKVPAKEKSDRLQRLLEIQEAFTRKQNQDYLNQEVEVLVEGQSKKNSKQDIDKVQLTGRTSNNKIVNFLQPDLHSVEDLKGQIVNIKITKAFSHSLWGEKI